MTEAEKPSGEASTPFPVDIVPALLEAESDVTRYLADYFSADEATGFTGRFFEQMIDQSDPYEFTPWDLAAVSTLSVEVPPIVAAKILLPGATRADRVNGLLASLPGPSTELADATEEDIADDSPAAELYKFLRNFKDMGPTKSSKLLAAKRPRLVPIRDSVVERLLGAGERWWAPMRQLSRDERLRALIGRASEGLPDNVTYLRRLDVVLWSYGSNR